MRALLTIGFMAAAAGVALAQAQAPAPPPPAVPTKVKVGDMAPDFTLQGTDGKTHKLSDYRGKQAVVVAWFPKAFTSGCTIECKSLAENGDKIQKFQVAYFMASTDKIEDNSAFAKATSVTLQGRNGAPATVVEKKEADFPMLADPTMSTARAYGVLNEERGFRESLDVLHRQDRQSRCGRHRRSPGIVCRRHGGQAWRTEDCHEVENQRMHQRETKIFDPRDPSTGLAGAELLDASVVFREGQWWMFLAGQAAGFGPTELFSGLAASRRAAVRIGMDADARLVRRADTACGAKPQPRVGR